MNRNRSGYPENKSQRKTAESALPSQLIVCLIVAMSLWSKDSMRDVLKNLVDGLNEVWLRTGISWKIPCKAAITKARKRLGPVVMSQLFHQLVRPMATTETVGAFLNELRVVAIDGTCLDLPDSDENARVFGRPGSRPGTRAAFPKARLVILVEAGTHLIFDALICPYKMGERVRALRLLRSVTKEMLLMWDRGLHSYAMVSATLSKGCDYLGRIPSNVKFQGGTQLEDGSYLSFINPPGKFIKKGFKPIQIRVIEYTIENLNDPTAEIKYRLITSLLDCKKFPAKLLAAEYHQRWEVENTIDEFKVHLLERKTHIRSQRPREVIQEIYGLLLGHWAVRSLICQTAHRAEVSPLSISFTGTLRVIRRAVPKFQRLEPKEIPFF
ncbi:IS4 family transposase [Microcoleus sp. herbarium7]|uniref:IS4 family transposase n=1 Tax=Microcoleus sp. herbarium7 TaxID=3055435 RepID=UPI002FD5DD7C